MKQASSTPEIKKGDYCEWCKETDKSVLITVKRRIGKSTGETYKRAIYGKLHTICKPCLHNNVEGTWKKVTGDDGNSVKVS